MSAAVPHRARFSFIIAAAVLLAACAALLPPRATAQEPKKPPAAAKAKKDKASKVTGLLYKLESTSATVYVLGSIHVANHKLYPLDPRILEAFDQSDVLITETELTPTAKARALALLQDAGTYPPPDSLSAHLDEKTRAALEAALTKRGLAYESFKVMRPWLLSLVLTTIDLNTLGYRADLGIDEHFRAKAARKHMAAIESVEQQVAVFKDMPEAVQLATLRQTLEQLSDLEREVNQAFDAWRAGNAAALDALMLAPMRKEFPKLYERVFVERNRRMADAIEKYLEGNGAVFVVVGSGHLVGPHSVLSILKQRGHKSQQL